MISGYDQNTIDEIEPQSSVSSNNINLASNVNEKEDVSDHALSPSAKSSEEKETVVFLNEEHKKRVSEEIRQTQKALRIDDLFEKIGMDKLQYIKTYSVDTILKFTDPQIQTIIDHFTEKPNMEFTDEAEDEEQDDEVLEGSDQNNVLEVLPPLSHVSNSSDDSKGIGPDDLPKSQIPKRNENISLGWC
ncbi:unnamed protein product [Rhizophagus irregularis]|nr:unnamed protein product [Rhizophagus irregularis]